MPKYICIDVSDSQVIYNTVDNATQYAKNAEWVVQLIGQVKQTPILVYEESLPLPKKPRKKRTPKEKSYGMDDVTTDRQNVPLNARCFLDGKIAVTKAPKNDADGDPQYLCMDHSDLVGVEDVRD